MAANLTNFKIIDSLKNGEFVDDSQGIIIHLTKENESLKNTNQILRETIRNLKLEMDRVIEHKYKITVVNDNDNTEH
tara:strand:- start:30 stop:260 length:231 start_codon:yes stop_codon:yes gene_type:complete